MNNRFFTFPAESFQDKFSIRDWTKLSGISKEAYLWARNASPLYQKIYQLAGQYLKKHAEYFKKYAQANGFSISTLDNEINIEIKATKIDEVQVIIGKDKISLSLSFIRILADLALTEKQVADMDQEKVETFLKNKHAGSYVFRKSRDPQCFTLSQIIRDGVVSHNRITKQVGGSYQLRWHTLEGFDQLTSFPHLLEVVLYDDKKHHLYNGGYNKLTNPALLEHRVHHILETENTNTRKWVCS